MRLADLQLAMELQQELLRLDEFAGPATLTLGAEAFDLSAEETAEFVAWKRERIHAELRRLGVEAEHDPQSMAAAGRDDAIRRDAPETRPPEQPQNDGPASRREPAVAPRSYEEARAIAQQQIVGPYADSQRVLSDDPAMQREVQDRIQRYAARRESEIDAFARSLLAGVALPAPACAECGDPATTQIKGRDLCGAHAVVARGGNRGDWVKRVFG